MKDKDSLHQSGVHITIHARIHELIAPIVVPFVYQKPTIQFKLPTLILSENKTIANDSLYVAKFTIFWCNLETKNFSPIPADITPPLKYNDFHQALS